MQSVGEKRCRQYPLLLRRYKPLFMLMAALCAIMIDSCSNKQSKVVDKAGPMIWKAPDTSTIAAGKAGAKIRYGRELLTNTAKYFGPRGNIAHLTNGMNCQNCHLDGGTRTFGNNYAAFVANHPLSSPRSGKTEYIADRISDCFKRSLAGQTPDTAGKEVQAMLAYMKWLGRDVPPGWKVAGTSTEKLPFMDRAADPAKGRLIYTAKCVSCHGNNGEGKLAADKISFTYPPLWGQHSYNDAAGMYMLAKLAGFVKNNMPYGTTYKNAQLNNQEAWDVAAYINSQPRPHKDQHADWPDAAKKPVDFPFGPYADNFSETQHKFGPFKPIKQAHDKQQTISKT